MQDAEFRNLPRKVRQGILAEKKAKFYQAMGASGPRQVKEAEVKDHEDQVYIYFIAIPGYIKIGMSKNPQRRIYGMQTASPEQIETIAIVPERRDLTESIIHQRFTHLRKNREWFADCPELRQFIEQHAVKQ